MQHGGTPAAEGVGGKSRLILPLRRRGAEGSFIEAIHPAAGAKSLHVVALLATGPIEFSLFLCAPAPLRESSSHLVPALHRLANSPRRGQSVAMYQRHTEALIEVAIPSAPRGSEPQPRWGREMHLSCN